MRKLVYVVWFLMFAVFCFSTAEAATKTIIEKDAQGNEVKRTVVETDKLGNETTTIINSNQNIQPQSVQQAPVQQVSEPQQPAAVAAPVTPAVPVVKKELKKGSNVLYGRLGLSIPTNSPDGKILIPGYEPLDMSWGTVGIELGATYLHFMSDYIAVGAEFGLDGFLPKTDTSTNIEVNQSTVFVNFLFLAHIYLNNPKEEARFYIPFGIGFGSASYTVKANSTSQDASGSGGCAMIGIGSNWRTVTGNLTGVELRYTNSTLDGNDVDSIKDQTIGIVSVLFYYGFDF